ncbi:MAG: beta galactosidase jelly roll domain-containing protein [Planctomycetota bacterium]
MTCVTEKAEWAFARWEQPADTAFSPVTKSQLSSRKTPTWWRTTFAAADSDRPLRIDLAGMTKGQVYLNGKHVGRYFASTATGAKVGPRQDMLLPAAWIAKGVDNDLVIFDEHGGNPGKIKLVHEKHEPFRA